MSESAEHPGHTCHGEVSPGKGPIGPDHCDGCEYETEMGQLRAEVERLRAKVTELSDEAYGYAEQVERLEEWQRQMVQKAADNSLDGYRELGAKCASLEERAEKAERERDEARAEVRILEEWKRAMLCHPGEDVKVAAVTADHFAEKKRTPTTGGEGE